MTSRYVLAAGLAAAILAAATAAHAAEPSVDDAIKAALLPEKPAPGDTRYGATFYPSPPSQQRATDAPQYTGWCIVAEEGTTPYDRKGKGVEQRPYRCWYQVSAHAYFCNYAWPVFVKDRPGVYLAGQEFLAKFPDSSSGKPYTKQAVAVGDGAVVGDSAFHTSLRAVDGPLQMGVTVYLRMQVGETETINPADIPALAKHKAYAGRWADVPGLTRRFQAHYARRGQVAAGIAQQVLASWRQFTQRKIGPGPHFKGLYLDVRPLLFLPEHMPEGFLCDNYKPENFRQLQARPIRGAALHYRRQANEGTADFRSESLTIAIDLSTITAKKPSDHVLADARDEFQKHPHVAGTVTAEPLTLRGADEAKVARTDAIGGDCFVVARRANAVVEVRGSRVRGDYRAETVAMAQRVLDRFLEVDKGAEASPAGPPRLQLAADPATLWADGRSTSRVRLTLTDAAGRGLPARFTLAVAGGGDVAERELATDARGVAETVYTAGTVPGTSVITASSPVGSARVEIREGGLALAPEKPTDASLLADGASAVTLVVRALGLDGKALAGLPVQLAADESRLPAPGRLEPPAVTLDADGTARVRYGAPAIDPTTGFRMNDVFVTATAAAGQGTALRADCRLVVHAGEAAWLLVEKAGFTSATRWPVMLPAPNATVRGRVLGRGYAGQQTPLAHATIRAVFAGQPEPRPVGRTDADGAFAVQLVGDPLSGREAEVALPEPLVVDLEPDLSRALTESTAALQALLDRGLDIRGTSVFLYRLPPRLAAADPAASDLIDTPQGLRDLGLRMARHTLYVKLVYERQAENLDWFMESAEPVVDQLAGLIDGMSTLEEAARKKLGDKFDATVWARLRKTVVGRVLRTLNVWHKRNTRWLRRTDKALQADAERDAELRQAVGLDEAADDSLPARARDLLHWAADPTGSASAAAQKATGTDNLTELAKTTVAAALKALLRDQIEADLKDHANRVLAQALARAGTRPGPAGDLDQAADLARSRFADYQSRHDRLNLEHLDRELYRLDTRLFFDTVVKGVFIYADLKTLASKGLKAAAALDPDQLAEIQKSVTESAGKVDAAAGHLDAAIRVYQGAFWLQDCAEAARLLDDLDRTLVP